MSNPPAADPINKLYDGLKVEAEAKPFRKPAVRYRVSELADCQRAIWYRVSGYRPKPDPGWLTLVSDSGNLHHDYVRQVIGHFNFPLLGVTLNPDGTVTEGNVTTRTFNVDGATFTISMREDGLVNLGTEAQPDLAILEIKSMGYRDYNPLLNVFKEGGAQAAFARIKDKHAKYVTQSTVGAMLKGVDKAYLLVVGRSGMEIGLHNRATGECIGGAVWEVDKQLGQALLAKVARIEKHRLAGTPPLPEYNAGSIECGRCSFFQHCWGKSERSV